MTDIDANSPVFKEPIGEDEKLLARLRSAGELDAVPLETVAAAKASYAMYTLDAELAQLTFDSERESDEMLVGVRGPEAVRLLTFESAALTVEVEAVAEGARRRLVGQLVPPQPGRLEIRHAEGTLTVEADDLGRFTADDLPAGPVSLRCQGQRSTTAVDTDWVLV